MNRIFGALCVLLLLASTRLSSESPLAASPGFAKPDTMEIQPQSSQSAASPTPPKSGNNPGGQAGNPSASGNNPGGQAGNPSATTGSGKATGASGSANPANESSAGSASMASMGTARRLYSGMTISVELAQPLDAKKSKPGDEVLAVATKDLEPYYGVVIPRGSKVIG